ncbi:MAG: glycosyltransferase [Bacteroidales bacterium]|nr:glycosyltransferase [Bacteroidales bacterium]
MFYKIKALAGIKIHLHCFEYGREHSETLEKYCYSVNYYKRFSGLKYFIQKKPYIVCTRSNRHLEAILLNDDYPILFEGIHTTYLLNNKKFNDRIKIVRTHNIEHEYYYNLYRNDNSFIKKYFFKYEAKKLKSYENILINASSIASISKNDYIYFNYKYSNVYHIPAFHPYESIKSIPGKGDYVLYHGNLSVGENIYAALFLINKIFKNIDIPFIIAGRNPDKKIKNEVFKYNNISLKSNLKNEELTELILDAHINILPAFQGTGLKLKLLTAIFNGRHCIVNNTMVQNTGLENFCSIKNTAEEIKTEITRLFKIPFTSEQIEKRKKILYSQFSNIENAKKIIKLLNIPK